MRRLATHAFEMSANSRAWPRECEAAREADSAASQPQAQIDAYKQAYLEGFEAGFADGDNEARKALNAAQELADTALQEAEGERNRWRDQLIALGRQFSEAQAAQHMQMEAVAVAIAYASVCRILGQAHAEQNLIAAICRETLASLRVQATQVRIAPAERTALEAAGLPLEIVADPTLQPGDCILVTGLGEIEASVETQMQALLRALTTTLRGAQSS